MNKVLVVADRIEDTPVAIKDACKFAEAYSASLHIVYFCYENLRRVASDRSSVQQHLLAQLKLKAEQQLNGITADIEFSYEVIWCKAIHKWINDYAVTHKPALVLKTGHRSESLLYTSSDWHLLRECPSPVLIASEAKWRSARNVMAAIDLETKVADKQALNHKILTEAKRLAQYYGTEMHVCYVPPVSPLLRDLGVKFIDEVQSGAEDELANAISELANQYKLDESAFHIHAGLPEKVIASEAAKYKAGVVVIGTVGRSHLSAKVVGNTAEKILSLLKTNVLALKP